MPSLILLVLLLSPSINACDGHHLNVHDKDFNRAFHHSSKDSVVMMLNSKTSSAPLKQASLEEEIQRSATVERPKGLEAPTKDVKAKRDAIVVLGAVRIPSLIKVSWRVPRKWHRENLGFDLDYKGPEPDPPSHNP